MYAKQEVAFLRKTAMNSQQRRLQVLKILIMSLNLSKMEGFSHRFCVFGEIIFRQKNFPTTRNFSFPPRCHWEPERLNKNTRKPPEMILKLEMHKNALAAMALLRTPLRNSSILQTPSCINGGLLKRQPSPLTGKV